MRLSPNGSRGTCIPQGLATFLQPLARRTNGMPQPPLLAFAAYKAPHLIHLGCFHLVDGDLYLLSIKTLEKTFIYLL